MNASFGIDHPLIAVHDIEKLRAHLISIGFTMTAVGKHPWGTSTSLAMFDGCLLEIMSVYDDTLIDKLPAGDFRFGRHVHEHLQQREGIALTALHSTDSEKDARRAESAGFTTAGHLEFGREVLLPDGQKDRTKTTLALLPNSKWPRLSFFLCQQHRPELIYVPQWLRHANSAYGICGISIMAGPTDHRELVETFAALYGTPRKLSGSYQLKTANGDLKILSRQDIEADFGKLPNLVRQETLPAIVGMDFRYSSKKAMLENLVTSGVDFEEHDGTFTLKHPEHTGNTFLRFHHQPT
ncbi:MAG: VOC family protein [Granulosicoccus sp.]